MQGYVPAILTAIANKWSSSSSRLYLKMYDVGINEWRVIAMLAIEPCITANRICEVIGLDKGGTSRSLKSLAAEGYLTETEDPADNRRLILELTEKGYELHDRIMATALDRERRLLADLSAKEIALLAKLLQRMYLRVPDLREPPAGRRNAGVSRKSGKLQAGFAGVPLERRYGVAMPDPPPAKKKPAAAPRKESKTASMPARVISRRLKSAPRCRRSPPN